jgi:putative Ca2+/H+ antiporter (TMEM165/GDT1 family)
MEPKLFATVFITVFLAELGDKTQLATLLYASDAKISKWTVFFAASAALVLTTALGVAGGAILSRHVSERALHWVAGLGFIAVGVWTLVKA